MWLLPHWVVRMRAFLRGHCLVEDLSLNYDNREEGGVITIRRGLLSIGYVVQSEIISNPNPHFSSSFTSSGVAAELARIFIISHCAPQARFLLLLCMCFEKWPLLMATLVMIAMKKSTLFLYGQMSFGSTIEEAGLTIGQFIISSISLSLIWLTQSWVKLGFFACWNVINLLTLVVFFLAWCLKTIFPRKQALVKKGVWLSDMVQKTRALSSQHEFACMTNY